MHPKQFFAIENEQRSLDFLQSTHVFVYNFPYSFQHFHLKASLTALYLYISNVFFELRLIVITKFFITNISFLATKFFITNISFLATKFFITNISFLATKFFITNISFLATKFFITNKSFLTSSAWAEQFKIK